MSTPQLKLNARARAPNRRWLSLRLGLVSLTFYSCLFLIKASMFACSWSDKPSYAGLNYKTCLALAQTFGYAARKLPALLYSPKLPHSSVRAAFVAVVLGSGSCVMLSCVAPPALGLALV